MSISRTELQDAARKAFGEHGLAPDADKCWGLMADMGWLGMTVPEQFGGLGLGREAAGVIHMELGRALVPGPAIAQMLAITALTNADAAPNRDDLLDRAMAGEIFAASLNLSLSAVPDADKASHVLVLDKDSIALVALADAKITPRPTWDKSQRLFDIALSDNAPRIVLAEGTAARQLEARLRVQLSFALAADSLGGATAVLEQTIEYLRMRRQFDRPLAMFQALKHRCADLKTRIVAAEALLWAFAANAEDDVVAAGALKAHATQLYADVAEEAIQLHGGIGLTEEHHCHLFFKRALLNLNLGGSTDELEEAMGHRMLLERAV